MKFPLESDIELIGGFGNVKSFPIFERATFRASVWRGEKLIADKIEVGSPGKCNAIARLRFFLKQSGAPDLKPFDFRLVYRRSLTETKIRERLHKSVFVKADDKLSLMMSELLSLSGSETQEVFRVVKHWPMLKTASQAWYVTSLLRGVAEQPMPHGMDEEMLHGIVTEAGNDKTIIEVSKKYDAIRKNLIKSSGYDPKSLSKIVESITSSRFVIENQHLFPTEFRLA